MPGLASKRLDPIAVNGVLYAEAVRAEALGAPPPWLSAFSRLEELTAPPRCESCGCAAYGLEACGCWWFEYIYVLDAAEGGAGVGEYIRLLELGKR